MSSTENKNMLAKAISIAAKAFEEKVDKGGRPYILHCLYVMNRVNYLGETAMIIGVLHDLLEDCPEWTIERMWSEGFSSGVIIALHLLTKKPEEPYMDYIKRIVDYPVARAVKMADLEHNSMTTRLKGLAKKDFDRIEKYFIAYEYLKEV